MVIFKICVFVLSLFGGFYMNDITYFFDEATTIEVTVKGKTTTLSKGDEKFEAVLSALKNVTANANEMPAFAVSNDDLTRQKLADGTWIELQFSREQNYNDLPFEALLIEVDASFEGVNLIRKINGKYEGRCFYLNLSGDLTELSVALQNLSINN